MARHSNEGVASARRADLRWVTDTIPGITRRRSGAGFRYVARNGGVVRDLETLRRIRDLSIPPAWTDVWISPDPAGHIQATGRDARGRKQYRYHPRWREIRDEDKFDRTIAFAEALPRIRSRVDADLRRQALCRERVLAAIVRLLDKTLVRVGNVEYARSNRSYGLTTMRANHVAIDGDSIHLSFPGKGGRRVTADVSDRRVARVMQRCTSLRGEELFQYVGHDGEARMVTSDDVNAYLSEIAGGDFTAKDFRTWAGTVIAARALGEFGAGATTRETKQQLTAAIGEAARHLGNTVAVCRRCYVHPQVLRAHAVGALAKLRFVDAGSGRRQERAGGGKLRPEERAVLRLLRAGAGGRRTPAGHADLVA